MKQPAPLKPKKCGFCREVFQPARLLQKCCRPACAMDLVERRKAKAGRKADQERRQQLKTISQLEDECRRIAQKIARIRDKDDGCISCHMGPNYRGVWHGSHYRAHGGCSSLQFHLWNIHKACEQCNFYKGGNREGYVRGLLVKQGYGRERLDWLDSQPKSRKFDREYLLRFKQVMGKRMRRAEKRAMETAA